MKYPIGIQSFDQIIEDGYVYVDKTGLVYDLAHEGKIYFLSRPRRFGKSLLVSTLENYFLGRKELFRGLAIEGLEKEWAVHPVFHVDFNGAIFSDAGQLEEMLRDYVESWERSYGLSPDKELGMGLRFRNVLRVAHEQTGRRAVVLIDEYDKPILDVLDVDASL
ncbi:AAA family ATPase, partial [uncultured Bacteroides sp.]|uniref:AAA family ATPase n=1 Tax=uncultured Bacteroides sp. TaxID=162156 RepID=UPI00260AA616